MARSASLHAVKPGDPPPRKVPKSLLEAIEFGTYLEILQWQRREVVKDLEGASGAPKAALHRQLGQLSREIAGLEEKARGEGGEDDDDVEDEPWTEETV